MKGSIIELSQKKSVAGRRFIRWIIHEIHSSPSEYNKNGISWREQYVLNNIESAKGMPICVEFLDWNNTEPFGHGMSGVKDGQPIFEDSVVCGVTENAYIDDVEVNGEKIRALIGEGYIFEQRYPNFTNWLKTKMFDGDFPDTSVEICTKKDSGSEVIIYENGWKEKGRVPMIYDYSGDAILGIEPSDDNAVLLELNNKIKNKEEDGMNKDQEVVVLELNNKLEVKTNEINSLNTEINSLKSQLSDKDNQINELNTAMETKTSELQAKVEEATTELNSAKETLVSKESEIATLTTELNELRQFKQEAVNRELVAELNEKIKEFTEEEKSSVKEKIETFSANPSKEGIAEIVSEINNTIAMQVIEQRKKSKEAQVKDEQNSVKDIYGDIIETNSSDNLSEDELY